MNGRAAGVAALAAWLAIAALVATFVLRNRSLPAERLAYPDSPTGSVVDDYHGEPIADPWRWLEDTASPETRRWVSAQNALTRQYIDRLPGRERFARRLRALLGDESRGVPDRENGVYVYAWNPGTAEQDALRVTRDIRQPGTVLLDPVALRPDGTASVDDFQLSPDGALVAWALSDGGSDWKTWRIREVATGRDLPEVLAGTKFTAVSWSRDGKGFDYSRYPGDGAGGYDDRRQIEVFYHRAGTPQSADRPVLAVTDHPTRDPYATATTDGRFLVFNIEDGYLSNAVWYRDLAAGTGVVKLLDSWDARYDFLGNVGDTFYFLTTSDAARGRVIAIDLAAPRKQNWRAPVPESEDAIEAAALIGDRLVVQSIHDVASRLRVVTLDGAVTTDVALPGRGSVENLSGQAGNPEGFLTYTDFVRPRQVYRLDVTAGTLQPVGPAGRAPDADRFVTEQVFFDSKDGTRVPMTIVRRRDVPPGREAPTVLYGYGGFNVSLLPVYSASRMAWIEAGGIYAVANLRGGGEYGEAWHRAGIVLKKQNVFDDFVAAAEWLVAKGYTSPAHLAIWGGSNGGLLVGAVLNQRPELFAAAVPAVGVMDMLRYQTASLNARKWSSDYGLSENPREYAALRAYSPYHNVRTDRCYPPVLVPADDFDDRVLPWHSYKYAAALQTAQRSQPECQAPVLIRIETRSGHGAGASLSKTVDEYADQWAFVAAATGLE